MRTLIIDPQVSEELIARRRSLGLDRRDEIWEGVWHMVPAPDHEHHRIGKNLLRILMEVFEDSGLGFADYEFNVADPEQGMQDLRIPDLAVVLEGSRAQVLDTYIAGGPDLIVEIRSPGDETYEKLPWYAKQGVREALVIDRDTKLPELYRLHGGALVKVASSSGVVESQVVPLRFERVERGGKLRLLVTHTSDPAKRWEI